MAWNHSETKDAAVTRPKTAKRGPIWMRGILAAFLVVLGASLACYLLNSRATRKGQQDDESPAKTASRITATASSGPKQTVTMRDEKKKGTSRPVLGKTPTGIAYVAHTAQTNADGVVVSRYQLEDGSWMRVVNLQSKESFVLPSAIDSYLAQIVTIPLNQPLPPMPPIKDLEKAFQEAIKTPIIIRDEDSEKAKAMKQAALESRQRMADLLREGYTVSQVLAEHESLREKNVTYRKTFQAELNDVFQKEGREAAEAYMKTANEKLEKHGIIPLTMPGSGTRVKGREQGGEIQ